MKTDVYNIQFFFAGFVLVALLVEIVWANVKKKSVFNLKESLGNFGIFIGNNIMKPVSLGWKYMVFDWISQFQIFNIPINVFTVILTFFIAEFGFYWYHRLSHETPLLWTLHHTHHSSMKMNLTTAVRLNWIGAFVSPLFYLPFVVIGFSGDVLLICVALGLFFQYFLHTEAIKKLGLLEGLFFNTPSAHRVHHGSNEIYIDKNYGGALIIFDRIFGTYQAETEKVNYGVTTGFFSNNPIKVNFLPIIQYLKGNWKREKQRIKEQKS
ncbi:sterol desaturase family protein [Croceitalea rosinachiae]|uniref:Sterol desaturase family protein n=1 Tax=Croceitalea rosinachiae TaxID=3075596 RepID=A0ABU3AAM1_9FLAO|nr:sterol desaturase family protein [Croceitalea sp. F388]MDT0605956.1 sterol desaturase family protein [Croceitalea sp. F388]